MSRRWLITLSIHATEAGMILGTAAYMSPEQARGKGVDKRADIWAFGAVPLEILTGQRAFAADDLSMTLAAVMLKDPVWAALPPATSPGVQQLLRRCLVKDPRQRIRDMGDVRLALENVNDPAPAADNRQPPALVWAAALTAIVSLAVAGFATFALWNRPTTMPQTSTRLTIARASRRAREAAVFADPPDPGVRIKKRRHPTPPAC